MSGLIITKQMMILNGYFIGTCFNGTSVFNMLKTVNKGESLSLFNFYHVQKSI